VPGLFISFEGADGTGKTTQLNRLSQYLVSREVPHLCTREPGGTVLGLDVRRLLLEHREPPLVAEAELLLYAADRAQHVREVLRPALEAGKVVLCDRYADATEAYQGYGRGLDLEVIRTLETVATLGLKPAVTLLFDLDSREALRRLALRRDASNRFDEETVEFHARVRAGYLERASREPERIRVVGADGTPDEVHRRVVALVREMLV
jgi:dTMP kinase